MEQDEGLDDMAQMMGFSAFGSQDRPQKKRKYNPNADSFVERQPPQAATTSSNSIPLGPPPVVTKPSTNADEIDLEDDDGEDGSHAVKGTVPGGGSNAQSGMNSLPRRPAVGAGEDGPSNGAHPDHGSRTQHNNRAAGHGGHGGKPWYDGYYDSISNENPWEKLEKAMNLQPIGGVWK
ncbi:unnamed protein product [Clonostachys byssicola]|uniref:Uncharacterized protein n=1 Tax=Clonostachys byssicola TaxID=160290 RepID=A0A9N9U4R8_9HYPO|nr:unnamed protein product [Clonostachys byssicola]